MICSLKTASSVVVFCSVLLLWVYGIARRDECSLLNKRGKEGMKAKGAVNMRA